MPLNMSQSVVCLRIRTLDQDTDLTSPDTCTTGDNLVRIVETEFC